MRVKKPIHDNKCMRRLKIEKNINDLSLIKRVNSLTLSNVSIILSFS